MDKGFNETAHQGNIAQTLVKAELEKRGCVCFVPTYPIPDIDFGILNPKGRTVYVQVKSLKEKNYFLVIGARSKYGEKFIVSRKHHPVVFVLVCQNSEPNNSENPEYFVMKEKEVLDCIDGELKRLAEEKTEDKNAKKRGKDWRRSKPHYGGFNYSVARDHPYHSKPYKDAWKKIVEK